MSNLQFSKVVKPEMGQWFVVFADLGIDASTAWVRSIHAARKKGDGVTGEDDLASFSTIGVLAILLFWCEFRRELARKAAARCILKTFLERSLTVGLAKAFECPSHEQCLGVRPCPFRAMRPDRWCIQTLGGIRLPLAACVGILLGLVTVLSHGRAWLLALYAFWLC